MPTTPQSVYYVYPNLTIKTVNEAVSHSRSTCMHKISLSTPHSLLLLSSKSVLYHCNCLIDAA